MGWFGANTEKAMGRVETVIGKETNFKGNFTAKNSIRVDGEINGNVTGEDGVVIGESGWIRGNVVARSIVVAGKVKGNLTAFLRVELKSRCLVEGDISTPLLLVEEGAKFEGHCQMEEVENVVDLSRAGRE